jgi:hypothetical protein
MHLDRVPPLAHCLLPRVPAPPCSLLPLAPPRTPSHPPPPSLPSPFSCLRAVFGVLCNALLQHSDGASRPSGSSSASPPSRTAVRPPSAIPASKIGLRPGSEGGEPGEGVEDISDPADPTGKAVPPNPASPDPSASLQQISAAAAAAAAGVADGDEGAVPTAGGVGSSGARAAGGVVAAVSGGRKGGRPASARARSAAAGGGRKKCAMVPQRKTPSSGIQLHAITQAAAQRPGSARRPRTAPAHSSASSGLAKPTTVAAAAHLESDIANLQARILSRHSEAASSTQLGMSIGEAFGARAGSGYAALIKHSLASVRRAEQLDVTRGAASDRNRQRDERIEMIRAERVSFETQRAEAARQARRAAKEELSYRALYTRAVALEKERRLLQAATAAEAQRKTLDATRRRATALESFHSQQMAMLHEQLQTEEREAAFRSRVQTAMRSKLEADARTAANAALSSLKEQLDHQEALCY